MDTLFSFGRPRTSQSSSSKKPKNEVDYTLNPTKLFKRVEGRAWESALERIQTNGVEAKIWVVKRAYDDSVSWKRLPLHEACSRKPTPKIVQALLQAYPNSARKPDTSKQLALHHACANGASLQIVEALLQAFPEAIDADDGSGRTPLKTLMSTYFPDPHIISALKRGPEFYKMQTNTSLRSSSPNRSLFHENGGSSSQVSRPVSSTSPMPRAPSLERTPVQKFTSPARTSLHSQAEQSMLNGLESEIGRYSEKLASSMETENHLQKRIRALESEVSRLLSFENDNMRMQTEIQVLMEENRMAKDQIQQDRSNTNRDLRLIDDLKRSEAHLKREVEDRKNDPTVRLLEEKVADMTESMNRKDERYDGDIQNLKVALRNAEEDAQLYRSEATKFEDDNNRIRLELKRLEYIISADRDTEEKLKEEISKTRGDSKHAAKEMEMLERQLHDQEDRLKEAHHRLQVMEEENASLRQDRNELTRLQANFHEQEGYVQDLEGKLRRSEDDIMSLSDRLQDMEFGIENEKKALDTEKRDINNSKLDLQIDLDRLQKKNKDLGKEKEELLDKLKLSQESHNQTKKERDDIEKKELSISLEVNKLHRTFEGKIDAFKNKWLNEQATTRRYADEMRELEDELKELRDSLDGANSANNDVMKDMLKMKQTTEEQEHKIETLQKKQEEAQGELENIKAEKQEKGQKLLEVQKKIEEMEYMNDKVVTEKKYLTSEKEYLEEDNKKLQEKVASFKATIAEQMKEMETLQQSVHKEKRSLMDEKNDSDYRSKATQDILDSLQSKYDTQVKITNTVQTDFDNEKKRLHGILRNAEAEKEELENIVSSLEETIESQMNEMEFVHNAVNREKITFLEEKEQMSKEQKKLLNMVSALSDRLDDADGDNTTLAEIKLGESELEIKSIKSESKKLRKVVRRLEKEKEQSEGVRKALQKENHDLLQIKAALQKDREFLEFDKEDLLKDKRNLEEQVSFLMKEMETLELNLERLAQEKIDHESAELDSVMKENDDHDHDSKGGERRHSNALAIKADQKLRGMQEGNDLFQLNNTGMAEKLQKLQRNDDDVSNTDEATLTEQLKHENELLKGEVVAILERVNQLQKENGMLRVMLEEEEDHKSLDDLEDRLTILEQTKDAEIATLVQERSELLKQIMTLRDLNAKLKSKLDSALDVEKTKQKRDRKKKTLSERLAAYENMSASGSVASMERNSRALDDKDETMSTVSGVTNPSSLHDPLSPNRLHRRQSLPSAFLSSSPQAQSQDWLLSKYQANDKSKMADLEGIFPSSVSVTGLSLSERSDRAFLKANVPHSVMVRDERRSSGSNDKGKHRLRHIMETREPS